MIEIKSTSNRKKTSQAWVMRTFIWVILLLTVTFMVFTLRDRHHDTWRSSGGELKNPHFYSIDERGKEYSLHAKKVFEKKSNQYAFHKPWAMLDTREWNRIQGNRGIYYQADNKLDLWDEVVLSTHDQYTINTTKASVYMGKKEIRGENFVSGRGPLGKFNAVGFFLNKQGIVLHGPADLIILVK